MQKTLLALSLLFVTPVLTQAQNGLENVIVEKYYISEANDTNANMDGGVLPIGSVTYRIYADMLPYYKFQAVYGVPGHEMRIETSTLFFNNEDRGATTPTFSKNNARNNTVMLDSWLSVGAACTGQYGVLKTQDDGVATAVNNYSPMVLQSTNPLAGIPVMQEDGFLAGSPEPVTTVGISTEITVFDNQNDGTNGPLFASSNGSWASLNGSIGFDSTDNKVLIAQITTDGVFSFELNIQIGTPSGGVENYVAQNPVGSEIQEAFLIYNSSTGINDNESGKPSSFNVYPNPAKDFAMMHIKSGNTGSNNHYAIYDIAGREVMKKDLGKIPAEHAERLDVSSLVNGYYTIALTLDGVTSAKQFIKN